MQSLKLVQIFFERSIGIKIRQQLLALWVPVFLQLNLCSCQDAEFKSVRRYDGYQLIIARPWWQALWACVLYAVLAVMCVWSIVFFRTRNLRRQLEQSKKDQQLAELRQQKLEMEMQALRAQMNPHFIFNSLNSINCFILENNKEQASEYLTKFSKLVRMILHHSQASLIPLESELECLQLYLDLEALRFDDHFDYKISVDDELNAEAFKLPPLIIQPYAENAIWHGLMHKKGKGQLVIEVMQEYEKLVFKISDNGIGRKQAAALSSKSATKHKSLGLQITSERLAMLSDDGSQAVTINDLVDAGGKVAGTEVIIKIPCIYD